MTKIRAFYTQALQLTLVFASLFFAAMRNLETLDSSVFVDQGAVAFPVTEERHISSCFSEQAKGAFPTQPAETFLSLPNFGVFKKNMQNRVRFLLSLRCMLLGNSFEPRSNSRVPNGTAIPAMIICLSDQ